MKTLAIKPALAAVVVFVLAGCGTYRSTMHNSSEWRAFLSGKGNELPEATIIAGKRQLAFVHYSWPTFPGGGYRGTLLAEDPSIVAIEFDINNGKTYLTGLKEGRSRIYFVNGFRLFGPLAKPSSSGDSYILNVKAAADSSSRPHASPATATKERP